MTTCISISDDEFTTTYKPVKNHLDANASYEGSLFETYGPELEFVQAAFQANSGTVWTLVDTDSYPVIVSGMHFVNRLGYLVTEVPAPDDTDITVGDDEDEPDNDIED